MGEDVAGIAAAYKGRMKEDSEATQKQMGEDVAGIAAAYKGRMKEDSDANGKRSHRNSSRLS